MSKIYWPILLLSMLPIHDTYCQPIIEWSKVYGSSTDDEARCIIETHDGGYAFIGSSHGSDFDLPSGKGGVDVWVCKIDGLGKIEWSRKYGGSLWEFGTKLFNAPDGNIIAIGYSQSSDQDLGSNSGGYDIWILTLSPTGEIVSSWVYGGSFDDVPNDLVFNEDGSFMLVGYTGSNDGIFSNQNLGGADGFIMKIAPNGKVLWSKLLGGSASDDFSQIKKLHDNRFVIGGHSKSSDGIFGSNQGGYDAWLVNIDKDGSVIWSNSYGSNEDEFLKSVDKMGDNILVGATLGNFVPPFNLDYSVFGVSFSGNLLWSNRFGGSESEFLSDVISLNDKEYVAVGNSDSEEITTWDITADIWMVKSNDKGEILWQKVIGGSSSENHFQTKQTKDGGFILLSTSYSNDGDVGDRIQGIQNDVWVVKLAPEDVRIDEQCNLINFYPNPLLGNRLSFEFQNPTTRPAAIQVFDITGRLVFDFLPEEIGFDKAIEMEIPGSISAGVYLIKLENCNKEPIFTKLVKLN